MGFDCVIEFCFFSPLLLLPLLFRGAERKIFLLRLVARVEEHVFGSGRITRFFHSWVTMATLSRKMCAHVPADCVCCVFMWNVNMCVCVCMHFCVCFCVCAPVSLSALLCCHLQPDKPKDLSPSELPLSGG